MALTIKTAESKPRVFTVTLAGSLDSSTYAELEKKIDYLVSEGAARMITLDVAGLEFISSMGLRILFKAQKDLARTGGSLGLARVPPPVKKALEIVEALPSLKVFASIQELDGYLARMEQQAAQGN